MFVVRDAESLRLPVNRSAALYQVGDPVGDENDRWILESIESCEYVIAAWGKHGQFKNRAEQVSRLLNRPIHCLAINGDEVAAAPPLH